MKRRNFIKHLQSSMLLGLAGSVPGLLLFPKIANAATTAATGKKRFFVLIRFSPGNGGWDVTLGLDPKTHAEQGSSESDMFIEYQSSEILSAGGLKFGPACAPLLPFASDIAVVNGIFMSDSNASHDANSDYISTGDALGQSADVTVELANATQAGAFGVLFNSQLKRANRTVMPTTFSNLMSMRTSVDISMMQSVLSRLHHTTELTNSEMSLIQNADSRSKLLAAMNTYSDQLASGNGGNDPANATQAAAVMASAFTSDAAYQAQLDVTVFLDTHSAHPTTHLTNQKSAWTEVATIFQFFKSVPMLNAEGTADGSLFDHTTFAVVSDFARTPALNPAKGKDHNPMTNSVLLAGAGVKGGQSIGASTLVLRKNTTTGEPRHAGTLIDYSNGNVATSKDQASQGNFQFVFPENVIATIAEIYGVDRSKFANVPASTPFLSNIVKR